MEREREAVLMSLGTRVRAQHRWSLLNRKMGYNAESHSDEFLHYVLFFCQLDDQSVEVKYLSSYTCV